VKRFAVLLAALAAVASAATYGTRATTVSYGVTLDNDAGISKARLALQTQALASLPKRPWARIVADIGTSPADFSRSLPAVHAVANTIVELGDSSEVKGLSTVAYRSWVQSLTAAYASQVDVWEVGNEVNGEWVGTPAAEMARVQAAYTAVKAVGGKTMLTLYYNPNCWARHANELFTWLAAGNVPATLASGLDYVTISYYPGDCNNYWPSATTWQSVFNKLHTLFPQAQLGFGEAGTSQSSLPVADRIALWQRYVAVKISGDNYAGLGLWWTWAEDGVPAGNAFWSAYAATL
jgi:hypothetical protein